MLKLCSALPQTALAQMYTSRVLEKQLQDHIHATVPLHGPYGYVPSLPTFVLSWHPCNPCLSCETVHRPSAGERHVGFLLYHVCDTSSPFGYISGTAGLHL